MSQVGIQLSREIYGSKQNKEASQVYRRRPNSHHSHVPEPAVFRLLQLSQRKFTLSVASPPEVLHLGSC